MPGHNVVCCAALRVNSLQRSKFFPLTEFFPSCQIFSLPNFFLVRKKSGMARKKKGISQEKNGTERKIRSQVPDPGRAGQERAGRTSSGSGAGPGSGQGPGRAGEGWGLACSYIKRAKEQCRMQHRSCSPRKTPGIFHRMLPVKYKISSSIFRIFP